MNCNGGRRGGGGEPGPSPSPVPSEQNCEAEREALITASREALANSPDAAAHAIGTRCVNFAIQQANPQEGPRQIPIEMCGRVCKIKGKPDYYSTVARGGQNFCAIESSPKCASCDEEVSVWHTHPTGQGISDADRIVASNYNCKNYWTSPTTTGTITHWVDQNGTTGTVKIPK